MKTQTQFDPEAEALRIGQELKKIRQNKLKKRQCEFGYQNHIHRAEKGKCTLNTLIEYVEQLGYQIKIVKKKTQKSSMIK